MFQQINSLCSNNWKSFLKSAAFLNWRGVELCGWFGKAICTGLWRSCSAVPRALVKGVLLRYTEACRVPDSTSWWSGSLQASPRQSSWILVCYLVIESWASPPIFYNLAKQTDLLPCSICLVMKRSSVSLLTACWSQGRLTQWLGEPLIYCFTAWHPALSKSRYLSSVLLGFPPSQAGCHSVYLEIIAGFPSEQAEKIPSLWLPTVVLDLAALTRLVIVFQFVIYQRLLPTRFGWAPGQLVEGR